MSIPMLSWFKPSQILIVGVAEGCGISQKTTDTRDITGRNWNAMCCYPVNTLAMTAHALVR